MASREEMSELLKLIVVTFLRDIGFKGSFPHFKRIKDDKLDLLMFQFSQWGKQFVVEIASCSKEGVTLSGGKKILPSKVKVYQVPYLKGRMRLPIGKRTEHWFDYEQEKPQKIAEKIISLIKKEAEPWWNKQ